MNETFYWNLTEVHGLLVSKNKSDVFQFSGLQMTDVELDARVTSLEENSDVGTPNGKLNKIAFQ